MQKPTLFFAVLMAMALSTSARDKPEPKMDNLMDRITKLNDHAIPVNAIPAEISSEHEHEKRGYSEGFHQIGAGFADVGGSLKNSTVDLWHKITSQQSEEEAAKEKADQEKADELKFIQKRGRNAAPRPVKAQPKPVKPKSGGRNKKIPGTSAVPLEKVHFKGAKRAAPSVERRAALWEHVQKVTAARSKRELHELHEQAKRSDIWEDLPHLVAKRENVHSAEERRAALWEHVQKVTAARSKREIEELHQEAKRSGIYEELPNLIAKRSTNPKKRWSGHTIVEQEAKPVIAPLGGQNATFSGPGLSGVAGNGTVTLTFNSTEVTLSVVNGTLAASAPLAVTTIQAAVEQLEDASAKGDNAEVVADAPAKGLLASFFGW